VKKAKEGKTARKIIRRKDGAGAVVISETEFQGKHYVDIRYNYQCKDTDELKPTKKGVSLTYAEFVKLQQIAKKLLADEAFMENVERYQDEQ
jgi:hypothetical protein